MRHYAIDQIMKLPTIKELTNQGTDVKFMIEEDAIVNEMIGYSIQVYEYQLVDRHSNNRMVFLRV